MHFPSPNGFGGIGEVGNVTSDNGALTVVGVDSFVVVVAINRTGFTTETEVLLMWRDIEKRRERAARVDELCMVALLSVCHLQSCYSGGSPKARHSSQA